MEKKKILIVDDESPIADMIADFCENFGFETKVLNSGENAVKTVKSFKPDLITMDLVMPETSGLEVIEMLKEDPECKGIPIIVISSFSGAEEASEILKLTRAVITKPVTMKVLGENIEIALAANG